MKHLDLAGHEIKPGDFIVYAALAGRSATMKYGRITKLAFREKSWKTRDGGEHPTVRAVTADRHQRWLPHSDTYIEEWQVQNKGKEITLGYLEQLLVIPEALVPAEALNELLKHAP